MTSTILIIGASSGLGDGMAREFAARGNNLALCARRTERLYALRDELLEKHPGLRISVRALDVNNHDQAFEVFRAQNHGHLVAVSSVSAVRGMPKNITTYAATKAGLAALAEGLRVSWPRSVRRSGCLRCTPAIFELR